MEERIILNKRYEIIEKIGDGGMAEVFHGFDTILHRDVTIKILRDQYLRDASFVERFKQEAYAAAKLSHPNIASVYDVGQEKGIQFIVLEYIVGFSLKECLMQHGPLPYKTAIKYASGVAAALNHAHSNNLVHCDVKSHNILINDKGVAKITDFGIAKAVGQSNIVNQKEVMGSVYYLAPEQAAGGKVTPQSDVYSLGVVLFEMLTGKLPFNGDTAAEVARQHLNCQVPSVQSYDPNIPTELSKVVAKALAKEPWQRYGSALEIYHDLQQVEALLYSSEDNVKRVMEPLVDAKRTDSSYVSDETMVVHKADILQGLEEKTEHTVSDSPKYSAKKIFGLFTVVLLGLGMLIYGFGNFSRQAIEVPNLKGKSVVEAQEILTKLKLSYSLTEEFDPLVKSGQISRQTPSAHTKVKEGREIKLVVSKGAEPGVVPDVRKKNVSEATLLLRAAQLDIGTITVKLDKEAKLGCVLSQGVKPGEKIAIGTKVDLVVNIGEGQTVVPDLVGDTIEAAKATLSNLGLTLGQVSKKVSKEKKDTVIAVELSAGKVVNKGSSINVTVAEEEPKESKQDSQITKIMEFTVPGKGKHSVKLVLSDASSSRVIYDGYLAGKAIIRQTVTGFKGTSVQFYVDDKQVEDRKL